jgi:gamma-glutamyltranspeptidase/glutathione hydrolase
MGRNSAETLHAMIEAKKLAWADRAEFYADPEFTTIPLAQLISKQYAAERRKLIDPNHAAKTVAPGNPNAAQSSKARDASISGLVAKIENEQDVRWPHRVRAGLASDARVTDDGDTIYMCTADDEGNMVSLIQSNYRGMGSGVVVPGLGFMFQDRGELFSMEQGHANVYAPGKRPFHTIIPGFVMKDGKPWEAFGVMGGGMQPQGHVQVLTNQIDFGLNVQEAGDASRWQHEGDNEPTGEKMEKGGYVEVESGIPYEVVRELEKRGHDMRFDVGGYGGYQAIKVEMHDGLRVYIGASESRKDGQAAGY